MHVVAGSEGSKDFRQAELDRHLEAMSRVVARDEGETSAPTYAMILRSASSAPALALVQLKDTLLSARVTARVVLAKLEPDEELRQLFATLSELAPREPANELIRWARNPRLLDAHEQAAYGTSVCWSGDAMRRDADKRNALSLFNDAAPDLVRLGRLAFTALWSASSIVPERHLVGRTAAKPSAAYERAEQATVAASLRPSALGWPLVRH
jgi:hypothetical protein